MDDINRAKVVCMPAPTQVGDLISAIDTPSLILDLDIFEDNLRKMQVLAERNGIALRPHAKAHKCPDIALRQIALGADGICCQKVSEAVPFIAAGVNSVHISNEVAGAAKLALLAQLAAQAKVTVCIDDARAAQALSASLVQQGASMGVFIEIDVGQQRCGVRAPADALALARLLQKLPNITFAGLQAYHGGAQHRHSLRQRQKYGQKALRLIRRYLGVLEDAGIDCPAVTGGGTGTAFFDAASGVYTELQAGSYAFMDAAYAGLEWDDEFSFQPSLFLLGTVMSTPAPDRAVVDIGLKSTSAESGPPVAAGQPGWICKTINDEHTILQPGKGKNLPAWGSQVRLIPSHCDPTFNLHDTVIAVRGQHVEAIWPISARGLSR